jgi:hypothetical protein
MKQILTAILASTLLAARAFALVPLQGVASKFLTNLKDLSPSQKPGDWSLDSLKRQIKGMTTASE